MSVSKDISEWSVNLLKAKCAAEGLKRTGRKAELVAR